MTKLLRRLLSNLTALALIAGMVAPWAPVAVASNSGTLNVVVSPATGVYAVLDNVTGATVISERSGSQSFVIPAGDYVVDFRPIAGYATPQDQSVNLIQGGIMTITGLYTESDSNSGTLHVETSPSTGRYDVKDNATGAVVVAEHTGSQTFILPFGDYLVDFKDLTGYVAPTDDAFTLDASNREHTSSGTWTYPSNTGTLTVRVTPSAGIYEIRDAVTGAVVASQRSGSQALVLPFGDYIVLFQDIPGYLAPADALASLDSANRDVTVTGDYTPAPTSGTLTINVSPATGRYQVLDNVTGSIVISARTGSQAFTLAFGDYLVDFMDIGAPYQTPADQAVTLDQANPSATVDGIYSTTPQTGSVTISVVDDSGSAISDADWALRTCTGATLATCTVPYSSGTMGATLTNVPAGTYGFFATATAGYSGAVVTSLNPQTLAIGATLAFSAQYVRQAQTGTIQINVADNLGNAVTDGQWSLNGPTPVSGAATQTVAAAVGSYRVAAVIPAGNTRYSGVSVSPSTTQALGVGSTLTFTVTYTLAVGTMVVNQNGALGTVDVVGPTPATVTTATYSDPTSLVGSYTLNITTPAGYVLADVRDGSNVILAAPYTQALANGATMTYNVNYQPIATTGIVNVNQVGAVGTVDLTGPSPASITTATYTNLFAGTGDYALNITVPAGFILVDVRDDANNVIASPYTQTLADGATIGYTVNYAAAPATGTINISQVGSVGTVDLVGPSPASVTTATYTNAAAGTGDYTINITAPAGFVLVDVRDGSNTVLASPYTQTLTSGGTIDFTVNYAPVTTSGTINVSQVGATGTVNLVGPSPANITTATFTNLFAGTGDYSLNITVPAGFNLVDVRDGANNVIASPYTQTLADGGTIDFVINYAPVTTSGTINVTQVGATGTADLIGPSPATITTATYTNGSAGVGSYTLAITAPVGFILVDVRDGSNAVLAAPYTQALTNGGTIDYTLNFAPVTTSGTINISQVGATGTVDLLGPSPAVVSTATYTNASAGTGSYALNITVPVGFNLVDVRDASNNILATPYTQTLADGGTIDYVINYAPVTTSGTINVTQVGATGTADLIGPSPATITTATYTNASAGTGAYTLTITVPVGFVLVDVRDAGNAVLAFPYSQTLADGATIGYTVNYAPVTTSGTVNVNQMGATGTLNLLGPSPANVTTATYTNASSGTGDYTLNGITAPAGFNLVDVRDGANNVIAAPYTQTLATGGTVTFTVNYAVAPAAGTINVNQVGATGTVDLAGPSPASITTATYTNASAAVGSYTIAVTVPTGFVLVDVRDSANAVMAFPYTQTLADGATIGYTVNYAPVTTSGTINVTQAGATGTVNLLGPSPANVMTATYTNASAGTGVYTINITTPAGFNLVDVRDGANNVIAAPYTQTLATGGTVTYTVNYAAVGAQPDPSVTAFTLAPGSATPMAGNTISYLISYGNLSAATASTGVTIDVNYDETHGTITLPAGCVDNTPVAGTMRCTVADLAPSATSTLTFNYAINAGVALGTNLVQVATISGSNGNSNATNDSQTATTPIVGAYTLTKTANTASAGDNAIVTYTITAVRNSNVAGAMNVTISDTVTATNVINGASGGTLVYILNSGTCTGVTCSGQNINIAPITVALDNPGSTATITYQARAVGGAIVGASSAATNSATGVSVGLPNVNASAAVTMFPPSSSGSTGTSSGSGSGGGGYKPIKGEMKLDIKKLVSTDGVNFKEPAAGKSLAIAVPENKSTRLYNKVLVTNLGSVSAIDIQFRHFFDSGKSDMTADEIQNLTGATVSSKLGLLVVDKVKVGETLSFTYSILVHENGQNLNPAVDGLELVSYGSNLSTVQDALTYLGLGSQYKTFLYAGRVPANADVTIGNTVPGTDVPNGTGIGDILSINLRADKPIANVGDTLTFTLTVKNVTSDDLTNLFLDHTFDPNAFEVADAFGAKFDGTSIHWTKPLLRPGEQATFNFDLKVKDSAPVGELVHGLTQALVNEYEGIAPFENVIRIGAAGTTFQLAQTGPASTLVILLILSVLASLGYYSLRYGLYLRTKKLALQEI